MIKYNIFKHKYNYNMFYFLREKDIKATIIVRQNIIIYNFHIFLCQLSAFGVSYIAAVIYSVISRLVRPFWLPLRSQQVIYFNLAANVARMH